MKVGCSVLLVLFCLGPDDVVVRAFLAGGKEVVSEQGFFLGTVPCAQVVD